MSTDSGEGESAGTRIHIVLGVTTSPLPPPSQSPVPFRRPGRSARRHRRKPAKPAAVDGPGEVKRLKADRPEDLLALMPYVLGFQPVESLVMMVISDRALKVTVRVDLIDDAIEVARRFGAIAVTNRATGLVLVAYSADPARADAMLLPVLDKLSSLRVLEALYTDGRRWWSRSCSGDCCPAEGTPYETGSNRLAAEAVFHGMTSYGERSEIERLTDGPPESDLDALHTLADELIGEVLRPQLSERRHRMRELVAGYVACRARGEQVILSDRELVTLALLAVDLRVRDEAWAAIERENAWIHVELWQQVVSRAVPSLATPVLCLLGIAAWIQGQGVLQVCCLERARRLDPEYSMTNILEDINVRAVPPAYWDRIKDGMREALDQAYECRPRPDRRHH